MHKRALGAVAVTGVAALALSACGGSSPTTPSNTAAGTAKATTTGTPETPSGTAAPVRDQNVDLVIWTDADRSAAVQKYADQFAAENGVTV
jgi:arabinogalactan oligomer/maltooligosaccharide transport system substrate-binding protein